MNFYLNYLLFFSCMTRTIENSLCSLWECAFHHIVCHLFSWDICLNFDLVFEHISLYNHTSQHSFNGYRIIIHASSHDDVIKWKAFPSHWPFVRGIHHSPVDSPHKGQKRGALMFSLICAGTNGKANNRDAGGLGRHCADYDVTLKSQIRARWYNVVWYHWIGNVVVSLIMQSLNTCYGLISIPPLVKLLSCEWQGNFR